MLIAADLIQALSSRSLTVGTAESLTGGLVVASLVEVPGASAVVRGGVVAYATDIKASVLGVDADLLSEHGAVHPEVARQMAANVRDVLSVDVGISTTGIAGPSSPDGQPVGTVHVGVATALGAQVFTYVFSGDRDQIRHKTVSAAIDAALVVLKSGA